MSDQAEAFLRSKLKKTIPTLNTPPMMRPGMPGYETRLPPPEDEIIAQSLDGGEVFATQAPIASLLPHTFVDSDARVLIAYGPQAGTLILSVESGVDREIAASAKIARGALKALLPVLRQLAPVRDLTGGLGESEKDRGVAAPSAGYRRQDEERRAPAREEEAPAE